MADVVAAKKMMMVLNSRREVKVSLSEHLENMVPRETLLGETWEATNKNGKPIVTIVFGGFKYLLYSISMYFDVISSTSAIDLEILFQIR